MTNWKNPIEVTSQRDNSSMGEQQRELVEQKLAASNLPPNIVRLTQGRRAVLKFLAAQPLLLSGIPGTKPPLYIRKGADFKFHCTEGYPEVWQTVYRESLEHFAGKWGKVGPLHVFLIENGDWEPKEAAKKKDAKRLAASQKELKRFFGKLQGHGSDGQHLDWTTGKHWGGWSIRPPALMITMTMSPYRDAQQFVIGPIHEYMHAYQMAYGYDEEAVDGNQMGEARWTGPAWWREGTAVLIAALYCYRHPELFKRLEKRYSWEEFSREMHGNLRMYEEAATNIRKGVTHDDWQRLEREKTIHQVVYAGGSVACALLLKKSGSLRRFMQFFPLVPRLGWPAAFQKHFKTTLDVFYEEFDKFAQAAAGQFDAKRPKGSWCGFLKAIK
jgi:hypothetical protein